MNFVFNDGGRAAADKRLADAEALARAKSVAFNAVDPVFAADCAALRRAEKASARLHMERD